MNLDGLNTHLDTVDLKQDEVAVLNEDFLSKRFICGFISLQAQKK